MHAALPFADLLTSADWLTLLDVSLTGIHLLRPVYELNGATLADFALEYVNPAGQRMMGLAEQPSSTLRSCLPHALAEDLFRYYRRTFETGEQLSHETSYQTNGLDYSFKFSARRSGAHLLASFTTSAPPPGTVANALRESQAAAEAARAEAETQAVAGREDSDQAFEQAAAQVAAERERALLQAMLTQAPVAIALFQGQEVRVVSVNERMAALWGRTPAQVLGQPLVEGVPELRGQGFDEMIRQVLTTGVPHVGTEAPADILQEGVLVRRYYNFVCQPIYDAQQELLGVLNVGTEVTEQVVARRRIEQLNLEAQAARAEAERQRGELERVLEQAPVAIAVYRGPTYTIELANAMIARLWGRTREQLLGRPVYEALPEAAGWGYEELMDGVMATGVPYAAHEMESRHERNGRLETLYWDFVYVPMYAAAGKINGVMVVATDTTTQVLARQQLEQLNQELETRVQQRTQELAQQSSRLRRLLHEAPAAIGMLGGPDLVFELVNARYAALFPGRELLGQPILAVLPELVDGPGASLLRQVHQTGVTFEGREVRMDFARSGDGPLEARYFDFIYQARYDTAGAIDGLVLFGFEVTEQVRARRQAEAGARQLQLLTDALPVLIGYLDRERRYRFNNEAYRAWFNQDPAALRGQRVRDIVGEKAYAATSGYMDRALAGERLDFEATMPYREGFTKHIHTSYIPDVHDGQVIGFYTLVQDVTEQVETLRQVATLNEQLATINQELAAANDELGTANGRLTRTNVDLDNFIYTASHDLRAPITNIEGLLLALREQLAASPAQPDVMIPQLLDMMQGAVERFQLTIAQLTDVARLQQAHDLPPEQVAVAEVIEAVRLDLAPQLTQAAAQLTVEVAPDLRVSFAPKNLRSVVYNLLSNAIKYRHPTRRPVVWLRAERREPAVVLTVQDNGLGLTEQQQGQLFGLFQRLHTHVEGTGVGLYMVKRMVENAGGTITVQSEPEIGTTFSIRLPA